MEPFPFSHSLIDLPDSLWNLPVISLAHPDLADRRAMAAHVRAVRATSPSGIVWGGYLEKRFIYSSSPSFLEAGQPRDIHLGIDIFADADSRILAPLDGRVHSFADNFGESNYGPTIILEHDGPQGAFHTLYGHLSRASLERLVEGMAVTGGEILGELGDERVNGNWPPHLHFQVIVDMEHWRGDYPGACSEAKLEWYMENCPDPMEFMA